MQVGSENIKRPSYHKGTFGSLIYYLLSMVAIEALALYFPMLLQDVTKVAKDIVQSGSTSAGPLVLQGVLVLLFIVLIFITQFVSEYLGAVYVNKYQANIREALYKKFSALSPEQLDQVGTARIMPALMNDTNWLKEYGRRLVIFTVYFPVAVLGSIIMLFNLSYTYALFAFLSLPFVLVFFYLNMRKIKKTVPSSVYAFDEYFFNISEGIKGAREIRILGKAEERSTDFAQHVRANRKITCTTNIVTAYSTGFNAILFTLITIAIVVYGAQTSTDVQDIVVLNTAIQYINKLWTSSHQIFVWFVAHMPRCRYTTKRLDEFYSLPEEIRAVGAERLPICKNNTLKVSKVTLTHPSGLNELNNVSFAIEAGELVAVSGGVGSGKTALSHIILKKNIATNGTVAFNDVNIEHVNTMVWRREYISYCATSPKFVPGTIRSNFKLFAPDITDEEILDTFKSIGASDFIKKFKNVLDYEIAENEQLGDSVRNLLNIVRAISKPAQIYVFNQCFEHVKTEYIKKLLTKIRKEKKTALFFTYDTSIVKNCDRVNFLKKGVIVASGKHTELIKSNAEYRQLCAFGQGIIVDAEFNMGVVPESTATVITPQTVTAPPPLAPTIPPAVTQVQPI
jgi:ABC-type multidrug transport system fused ATPase/permease subunit